MSVRSMEIDELAWARIDLAALESNYREVARRVGADVKIIGSVKANAYGHGAVDCATRLSHLGVYALATGDIDEAIAIREAGIKTALLMFGSYLPEQIPLLLAHDLIPTVYNLEGAMAAASAAPRPVPVYVKVDCGLGRLGVGLDDAADFIRQIGRLPNLDVAGIYTHLPFFDAAGRARTAAGLAGFESLCAELSSDGLAPAITQALASAAVLTGLRDRSNAVCVGHLLYGLSPMSKDGDMSAFAPVLEEVGARLIHIGIHPKGRDVAIGGLYGISNAMTTGVLPVGLHHGMRGASPGKTAEALFRGRRVRVMSVSLEHTTLDLTGIEDPRLGEPVYLLGGRGPRRISIGDVATWQDRSPLEVVMTYSTRLPGLTDQVAMEEQSESSSTARGRQRGAST
jgi:alanine racemase